ncbi:MULTISPECIES: hypothetical protein [unclassified Solwaraspora]|uniref:hypothetical protein n=1 Tax=unclassified Solwaraspora TaxID=2627926 RepID=UPI00248BE0E0|nr:MULTISPECIES: hypothetical protein [unclassified Solwaraspora]WBB97588.1 hypothetical protein O7553_00925 [Solwaraspora sp. WMMA2059]WBC18519.1 hypothetical protein O7543_16405 [Solwaraspora sp. WMMA2080]WJK34068.1 hypothetical protein O7610_26105 [Solwaraspora sp. WMMA2065]
MAPAVRFLLITTEQIVVVVVAFAFVMTLLFDRAGWWEFGWLVDLLPLLTTIVVMAVRRTCCRRSRTISGRPETKGTSST